MLSIKLTQEQTYKLGWGIPDRVVTTEKDGWTHIGYEGNEKYKGACLCGHCNNIIEGTIYYVPILDETFCKDCYDKLDITVSESDKEYEKRNWLNVMRSL